MENVLRQKFLRNLIIKHVRRGTTLPSNKYGVNVKDTKNVWVLHEQSSKNHHYTRVCYIIVTDI